jgi:multiple sugar transport system permease protein
VVEKSGPPREAMRKKIRLTGLGVALTFLLPNFLGFLAFTAWPLIASFLMSFTSWDLLNPPRWVGLSNFVDLLGFHKSPDGWKANDPLFWKYFGNTLFFLIGLPINMVISLLLAVALNQNLRFTYVYRLIFFLPSILAGVAIFYLWRFIYNPQFGPINSLLAQIGIAGPDWLASPLWAKPALMLMGSWAAIGGTGMILYLAALQGVPKELYEAAEIDGAGFVHKFFTITWPSVAPVTFFILTMGLIHGLQSGFDAAYIMTGGGPYGSTTTLGYYIYRKAYELFEMGYASAIAWVLFALIFTLTALNWKRNKHAAGD